MPVWFNEIKELEKLHESLKGQSPELDKELEQLIKFEDPNVIMLYSRRCLEVIITDLCECELKRSRKTEPLKGIIDKLHREDKVPSHIITSMDSLNSLSTYGTHPKEFDPEQVKPVLSNLAIIIKWYLRYKEARTSDKIQPEEKKSDSKELVDVKGKIRQPKKRLIFLLFGFLLIVTIIFVILFAFDVIGGEKHTKDLEKSIAVLPFVNDSEDKENTHIINGLMEEILLNLQAVKELRVPGRTSVEQYRNPTKSIPEIAKELDVNYIVEGSGQKYGNTIRLRVQLLDGAKGWHLWGDSYEQVIESPEDIFKIQSQIAQSIAAELKAIISPEEKQLIEKSLTSSLTAYDFYLRGREEYIKYRLDIENTNALEKAEKFYLQALEHDTTYAQAFTGLAMVYWDKHYWGNYFTENFLDSVLILSDIALSYDAQLAEAYSLKGDYFTEIANYNQALNEYEKALKINPNYWQAYAHEGELHYYYLKEYVKAFEDYQKAVKLNHDPELYISISNLADAYCYMGFFDEAKYYYEAAFNLHGDSAEYLFDLGMIETLQENNLKAIKDLQYAFSLDTTNINILSWIGILFDIQGDHKTALEYHNKYIDRLINLKTLDIRGTHRNGYAYWKNGYLKEAEYYFNLQKKYCEESIELNRGYAIDGGAYYDLAGIYAFRGEKEKAFENLRIYNNKIGEAELYGMIWFFKNDPLFDGIRNEPEFQEIFNEIEAKYKKSYEEIRKWMEGLDVGSR